MNQTGETLIRLHDVSVIRYGKHVLDHVSMEVKSHDFITIVGPNGAGKTTLLHTLLGIIKPDEGFIESQHKIITGYVPQRLAFDRSMPLTVRRFLELSVSSGLETLTETLEILEIPELQNSMIYGLSGGELQRVMLARALLRNPAILILDEPAQNLDVGGQLVFYRLLEKVYKQRQCAIVMVSHDIHMVMASSSKVLCLFHHVCCSGEPSAVAQDPKFQELFGEDVSRMMAIYHHAHSHLHEGEASC